MEVFTRATRVMAMIFLSWYVARLRLLDAIVAMFRVRDPGVVTGILDIT